MKDFENLTPKRWLLLKSTLSIIRKWDPDVDIVAYSLGSIILQVHLHGIPYDMWGQEVICKTGSALIGIPLTTRIESNVVHPYPCV